MFVFRTMCNERHACLSQDLMVACFGRKGAPTYILEFANYVARLDFAEKPNYELCREMFKQAILKTGYKNDMQLIFEGGVVRIQSKRVCRKSYQLEKQIGKKHHRSNSQVCVALLADCFLRSVLTACVRKTIRRPRDQNLFPEVPTLL